MNTQYLDHMSSNKQVNIASKYVQYIRDNEYHSYKQSQMTEYFAQREIESAEEK